ncbi:phosphotransferase family protein [Ilumatobacter nonamiensis]|uniref:phosphotransferase family protein n=1 Tax=Ilumatobacter nonamiensis TaxID=467093 RepID=UPI000348A610|nr:phosphotransferase family protein [Ilumatobacter nonamiensis]
MSTNETVEGVDLDRLRQWMDEQDLGSGDLTDVAQLTGGTQNVLVRFRRDGRDYVLRRPPLHKRANSDETMRRESRVLAALAGTDVPHPRFIAGEPDDEVLGASFYLMEPVDGFNAAAHLPEPHRSDPAMQREMGLALIDGAATLSTVDHEQVGLGDLGRPDGYLERQVGRWRKQLAGYREISDQWVPDIPGIDDVGNWLDANRPESSAPGIIHGDYHTANVMYRHDGPQLAAIVDWELTTIGDPLIDLGLIIAFRTPDDEADAGPAAELVQAFPSVDDLVARYAERSGRDVSAAAWYGVLACYKTGIILEGTHVRAIAGKAPKATGDTLHAITLSLFRKADRLIRQS